METLFVSDLHLTRERAGAVERFLRFLSDRARRAEALYILGDLFDAWIGDDDNRPPGLEVVGALRALSDSGTHLYFLHGNRDFLVGRRFARAAAARCCRTPSSSTSTASPPS